MVAGLKVLLSVGAMLPGAATVKVSLAGATEPLSVTKESVVFTWGPGTAEVTVPVTVQKLLAGIEPFVKVTVKRSFTIPALQVLRTVLMPTNVTSVGNVSPNDVKLAAVLLELLKVIVSVEVPPTPMLFGLKDLMSVGNTATEHAAGVMRLLIIVTAPAPPACIPARSLPDTFAPLLRLMSSCARMVPMNSVVVSRVAALPICQKTLHAWAPPLITTDEPDPVIRVLTVLKIQTSVADPVRVSVPVKLAEDAKQ
jgi:hypothetical protein